LNIYYISFNFHLAMVLYQPIYIYTRSQHLVPLCLSLILLIMSHWFHSQRNQTIYPSHTSHPNNHPKKKKKEEEEEEIMGKHSCCAKQKLRKGLWSPEEDEKLYNCITHYGVGCWSSVPKLAGIMSSFLLGDFFYFRAKEASRLFHSSHLLEFLLY